MKVCFELAEQRGIYLGIHTRAYAAERPYDNGPYFPLGLKHTLQLSLKQEQFVLVQKDNITTFEFIKQQQQDYFDMYKEDQNRVEISNTQTSTYQVIETSGKYKIQLEQQWLGLIDNQIALVNFEQALDFIMLTEAKQSKNETSNQQTVKSQDIEISNQFMQNVIQNYQYVYLVLQGTDTCITVNENCYNGNIPKIIQLNQVSNAYQVFELKETQKGFICVLRYIFTYIDYVNSNLIRSGEYKLSTMGMWYSNNIISNSTTLSDSWIFAAPQDSSAVIQSVDTGMFVHFDNGIFKMTNNINLAQRFEVVQQPKYCFTHSEILNTATNQNLRNLQIRIDSIANSKLCLHQQINILANIESVTDYQSYAHQPKSRYENESDLNGYLNYSLVIGNSDQKYLLKTIPDEYGVVYIILERSIIDKIDLQYLTLVNGKTELQNFSGKDQQKWLLNIIKL
ncbi:Hypothetical_protein [Hexamita inflata]|uniref:Hypothetical_protein n=1 Tax=Hexamita inflata TaxID=28002 RepID=A0AA86PQ82_9EUKA|nr:Hypothetical protein HINF_LOCUS26782 [Hexamita inflata]